MGLLGGLFGKQNSALASAVEAYQADQSDESLLDLWQKFLKARVLVATTEDGVKQFAKFKNLKDARHWPCQSSKNGNGVEYLATFTDSQSLQTFCRAKLPQVEMTGEQAQALASGKGWTGIAINPGSPEHVELKNWQHQLLIEKTATAYKLHEMAIKFIDSGSLNDAEAVLKGAIQLAQKDPGAQHPFTAELNCYLAKTFRLEGKFGESEWVYKRALSLYESSGMHDLDVASTAEALASVYKDQNKIALAAPLLERAFEIFEKVPGARSEAVARVLLDLADLRIQEGNEFDADQLVRKAVYKLEERYHASLSTALIKLAYLCQQQKHSEEAASHYRRAITVCESDPTTKPGELGQACHQLAVLLLDGGDTRQAEPLLEQALQAYKRCQMSDEAEKVSTILDLLQADRTGTAPEKKPAPAQAAAAPLLTGAGQNQAQPSDRTPPADRATPPQTSGRTAPDKESAEPQLQREALPEAPLAAAKEEPVEALPANTVAPAGKEQELAEPPAKPAEEPSTKSSPPAPPAVVTPPPQPVEEKEDALSLMREFLETVDRDEDKPEPPKPPVARVAPQQSPDTLSQSGTAPAGNDDDVDWMKDFLDSFDRDQQPLPVKEEQPEKAPAPRDTGEIEWPFALDDDEESAPATPPQPPVAAATPQPADDLDDLFASLPSPAIPQPPAAAPAPAPAPQPPAAAPAPQPPAAAPAPQPPAAAPAPQPPAATPAPQPPAAAPAPQPPAATPAPPPQPAASASPKPAEAFPDSMLKSLSLDDALKLLDEKLEQDPGLSEAWFKKGRLLLENQRFDEAHKCFDKVTSINASDVDAWYYKGLSLYEKQRFEDAVYCFNYALRLNGDHLPSLSDKADCLTKLGRTDQGLTLYDKALALDPKQFLVWFRKARTLANQRRFQEAIACYDKALALQPENQEAIKLKNFAATKLSAEAQKH